MEKQIILCRHSSHPLEADGFSGESEINIKSLYRLQVTCQAAEKSSIIEGKSTQVQSNCKTE